MEIYLPIAEMAQNILLLLALGGGVGFLSGMFGVGGGFLMTPLLMFIGIPPAVAVATGANQTIAASVSGVIAHWHRGNVDVKMGTVLLIGGFFGSTLGAWFFKILRELGQVDLVIALSYVVFLGTIGALMLWESSRSLIQQKKATKKHHKLNHHTWMHGLPFKLRFRKSRLYISALLPLVIGFIVGILSAIMGVGGGFIVVPAMIYLLGMPTAVVVGTSLFQIIVITANVTFLHALNTQTVDVPLAIMLLTGAVIGAQFGTRVGVKLKGEQLRGLLAVMVLGVAIKMAYGLVATPDDLFSVTLLDGG